MWSIVALVAQLGAFLVGTRLLPDWRVAMERGETASAVFKATLAVGVGLLNAACLTP